MAERERCVICRREIAGQADWDLNAELSDEQAAAAGLDALCWEIEDDSCMATVIEKGGPQNYIEAMTRLDSLIKGLEGEVSEAKSRAARCISGPWNVLPPLGPTIAPRIAAAHSDYAARLSKLIEEARNG